MLQPYLPARDSGAVVAPIELRKVRTMRRILPVASDQRPDVYDRLLTDARAAMTSRTRDADNGEIVELESLPDDPHLQAVGFFRKEDHPTEGRITVPDTPVQFSPASAASSMNLRIASPTDSVS